MKWGPSGFIRTPRLYYGSAPNILIIYYKWMMLKTRYWCFFLEISKSMFLIVCFCWCACYMKNVWTLDKFISNKYVHVVLFSIFLDRSTISLFRKQKVEKSGKYEYKIKLLQEENLSVKHHSIVPCVLCRLLLYCWIEEQIYWDFAAFIKLPVLV